MPEGNPFDFVKKGNTNNTPKTGGGNPFSFIKETDLTRTNTGENTTIYNDTQYDEGFLTTYGDIEEYKRKQQGVADELGNGIARAALKIVPSVVQNLAYIGDLQDYANGDEIIGNGLTQAMDKAKSELDQQFPIYGGNRTLDVTNHEWIINQGSNLIESAGAFVATGAITGGILGKGAQLLGNLGKLGYIPGAIATTTNAVLLNQAEGKASAVDVYKTIYQNKIAALQEAGLEVTPELDLQAKKEASDAGEYVLAINSINIPLNLTSAGAFIRPPQLTRQLVKNTTSRATIKNILKEGGQEYLEENINFIAEQEGIRKGIQGENYKYDPKNTISDVFSEQGLEAGILGFLGGSIQTAGTQILNNMNGVNAETNERYRIQQERIGKLDALAKSLGQPDMKETLQYVVKQSQINDEIATAAEQDNDELVKELKDISLQNQTLQAFKTGTAGKLVDLYKSLQQDPTSSQKFGENYQFEIKKALTTIDKWENKYNTLRKQVAPEVLDEVYSNRVDFDSTKDQLANKKNEVLALEGEKTQNDFLGVQDPELEAKLLTAKAKETELIERTQALTGEFQLFTSPEYLAEKVAASQPPVAVGPEVPVEPIPTPTEQAEIEEIKPIETPEGPKFKSKTQVTNLAQKAYEQDEAGNNLINPETGRPVKSRASLNASSPSIKVGDKLIYRLVPGQDPNDPNAEIEVAHQSTPERSDWHIHRMDWIDNGVAEDSVEKVRTETQAIRDAIKNSPNGTTEGVITSKGQGFANFENASGSNGGYTHSLVDTFGDQDPNDPTKFGDSTLSFTGNKIEESPDFVNARVPNKLYVNVPTPNGKLFASFVRTNSLKDLGQSEVITTAIQNYLDKKDGFKTIEQLRDFIYNIYPDKSDTSTPFRLSGKDKLTIEYGNSVFTEGSDFDAKSVQKYLDKAPYRVNTDLLQNKDIYTTSKIVDGNIVEDVSYPNYASYLGNKVIKTNMYPEFTSSNERVFFHQPNVGIGLNSPVTVDKTTGPDVKLKEAINSGDINAALDAITKSDNRYSKLALTLSGKLDGFTLVADPKLRADGKYQGTTITINPKRSLDRTAQALMHEAVHALTVSKIEAVQSGNLNQVTGTEVQAINNLEDLFNELQANNLQLPKDQQNALKNLPEFVAEVMTNKGLQKTLNKIPYGTDKTVLDQIIEFIKGIVGIDVQPGSALEKALNESILLINDGMIVETGEYLLPSKGGFEGIDTGDAANNEYIRRLNNQIRLIRDKLTGDPDKDAELNTQIFGVRKQIGLLINTPDILRVAEDQLRAVDIALDGQVDASILLSSINTIKGWSDIQSLLQVLPNTAKQTKLKLVIGDAALLEEKWLQKSRDYYYKVAKEEGSTLTRKELEIDKDIDQFMMYGVDGSISNSAIELEINRIIKIADFKENEEITKKGKELEAQMKSIGGNKAVFTDILQQDDKGLTTGNLLDEFKSEYYTQFDAQEFNSKEGLKWLRENTDSPTVKNQVNTPEGRKLLDQYVKDRASFVAKREAFLKKKYLDKNKKKVNDQEIYEGNLKKDIEKWERENSPYLREQVERQVALGDIKEKELAGMSGRKYMVQPIPKSKWADPRYQALKANDKMFKFYNFFKSTFTEYLPYIEGSRNVRSNAIPQIKKTLSEQLTEDGAVSILKGVSKKVVESFTVDVNDDVEYNNLDPATGVPMRRLRTRLLSNNLAPNEKSYDLARVLTEWIKIGAAIKYKSQVQDKVLLGEKLLQNAKTQVETVDGKNQEDWQGANVTQNGVLTNVQRRVEYTIDAFFGSRKALEGVSKIIESGPLKGKRVATSKIGDSVIKWGQAASLGLNVISAGANVAFGQLTNIQHAAGGQDFTTKQIFSAIGTIAKGVHDQKTRKKVALFMEKLQVMGSANPTNYGAKSSLDWMYFMSHYGEVFVQGQTMIATMLNTPVIGKDGKSSNAWDAYEVDNNGELKLLPNFDNSAYADVDGSSSMQTIKLSNKIIQLNKMLHGDYDVRSPKLGKKSLLGRSLLVFKNWVPRAYLSRFGSERYDPALERDVKGRYRSLELKLDTLKNLYALSFIGQLTGAQTVANLSPTDRANLQITLREALLLATMYAASVALRGLVVKGDDDEPSQYLYKVALDTAGRIESDMAFWARPDSLIEMMKNPMAPLRTLENFTSFVSTTSGWVIGNEPINKVAKKGVKLIPVLGTAVKTYQVGSKVATQD